MNVSDMDTDVGSEDEMEELGAIRRIKCANFGPFSQQESQYSQSSTSTSSSAKFSDPAKHAENSRIDCALALNKQCDEKLQRLEKVLESRLLECRDKLRKVRGQNDTEGDRTESFRYINCGRPYFKDKENFVAPDNSDAIIMAKNNMYDFSSITTVPGWTMKDKSQLWNQLEKITRNLKRKELQTQVSTLKRKSKNLKYNEKKAIDKKIASVKKEISKIGKKSLHKLALPIDQEYDWEDVTHSLDRRHTPVEYRALWKLYLHPTINKTSWGKAEHQLLQRIAQENGLQDWDEIARQMGNNRTGYQCFVYFRTNMNNTFTGKKWTKEEIAYLLRLIDYYKEDDFIPWVKVASLMENRTKIQIYNKYSRLLEERKGRFLVEEDAVILTCADEFGSDYRKMAQFLPGRSISQIRVRYQALAKKRVSTVWTVEEDRKLLQLLTNQECVANYASVTKYFPGKDRINIRARYVTLVKWMRRNPNADISKAPRRGARRLGHGKASDSLNGALENLKSRIQTEANKRRINRISETSTEEDIEDGIIAALVNETMSNQSNSNQENMEPERSILQNDENAYDRVNDGVLQKILVLLRAKLNKPRFESRQTACPKLVQKETCVIKVKSYSKQNKIKSVEVNAAPDIWGVNPLKTLEHILPPNYATITGCRQLMRYIATKYCVEDCPFNISTLVKRNVLLREQLDILMERFNTLFLWPLILSDEGPSVSSSVNYSDEPSHKIILCSVPEDDDHGYAEFARNKSVGDSSSDSDSDNSDKHD